MRHIFPTRPVRPQQAFTLLELLAVIAVIGMLCGIGLGTGHRASEAGRLARTRTELAVLVAALENYQRLYGDYPQTDDEAQLLQSLIGRRDPLNALIGARSLTEAARFSTSDSLDPFTDPRRS